MFLLEVSPAIIKVAKKKKKKKRKDKQLQADVLKAVLFSALPLPMATAADIVAHRASTAKNKGLYLKVIEEAKRRGISVRKWPKKALWRRMAQRGGFAEGAQITTPDMSHTFKPGDPKDPAKNIRIFSPEVMTAGETSGKTIMWPPSGESPGLTSHELGHTEQRRQSGWLQKLLPALGSMGALGGMYGASQAKTPEGAQRAALIGAGIAAIPGVANLGREAGASYRGLRTLRGLGATRGQMLATGLTEMAPSFLASAARSAVLPLAAYFGARALGPRRKRKKKKEKK